MSRELKFFLKFLELRAKAPYPTHICVELELSTQNIVARAKALKIALHTICEYIASELKLCTKEIKPRA